LDITILTNDVSFFSDTKEASHKRGMNTFWDRVKPHFLNSKVRNLHIVVATTDSVVEQPGAEEKEETNKEEANADKEDEAIKDDEEKPSGSKDSDTAKNMESSQKHPPTEKASEMLVRKRAISIAESVNVIQQQLDTKAEDEFRANRSFIQFDSSKHLPSINMHISTIDNSYVGFQVLVRKWCRDKLSSQNHQHRLTFELPETMDFAQCSVSLDAMYKTVPFRFDSALVQGLSADLELLEQSKLEVVQLIPIASIDASLLYGIAIGVRAGLEDDLSQYHEMGLLVRSLFKHLAVKDCALLLRSTNKGPDKDSSTKTGLFHSNDEEQSFLLMAEEIPSSLKERTSPHSGVLYRMASADHFLQEMSPVDAIASCSGKEELEDNPYSEFMETSLDCLGCSPVNPLYLAAKAAFYQPIRSTRRRHQSNESAPSAKSQLTMTKKGTPKNRTSKMTSRAKQMVAALNDSEESGSESGAGKEIGWNDDSGVGVRARGPSGDDSEEITDESEAEVAKKKTGGKNHTISTNAIRKQLIAKTVAASKKPQSEEIEEVEWTDCSAGGYSSPDSESGDSDAGNDNVGVFEYSQ
jgi:hypothetical protein